MKHVDLIRSIEKLGCVLVRHGAKHDWYRNLSTGMSQPVPRHREMKEQLVHPAMPLKWPDTGMA